MEIPTTQVVEKYDADYEADSVMLWAEFKKDEEERLAGEDQGQEHPPEEHFCESPSCLQTSRCCGWKDEGFAAYEPTEGERHES